MRAAGREPIAIRNNSDFPVDVNITSVRMTVKRDRVEREIYQAVVETGDDTTYDLSKEAEAKTCHLVMQVSSDGSKRTYRIEEGQTDNVTTFTLGTDAADNNAAINLFGEATYGRDGWDEGDLKVKITFDFRQKEQE